MFISLLMTEREKMKRTLPSQQMESQLDFHCKGEKLPLILEFQMPRKNHQL